MLAALVIQRVPGASFAVDEIRAPRVVAGLCARMCCDLAGASFQDLLRNDISRPDVSGISTPVSTVRVFGIVVLEISQWRPRY